MCVGDRQRDHTSRFFRSPWSCRQTGREQFNLMSVNGQYAVPAYVARGLDIVHRAPIRDVGRFFVTCSSFFRRRASPALARRWCPPDQAPPLSATRLTRKSRRHIPRPMLSGVSPSGNLLAALVVARQVRTDDLPAIAAVGGDVHKLASHIHPCCGHGEKWRWGIPNEAVLDLRRRCARHNSRAKPRPRGPGACARRSVLPCRRCCRSGARGPDDVVVHWIRYGEAALTSGHRVPRAARDVVPEKPANCKLLLGPAP